MTLIRLHARGGHLRSLVMAAGFAALAATFSAGCGYRFPEPVAVQPPAPAQGLRVLLVSDHASSPAIDNQVNAEAKFYQGLARVLTDMGFKVVGYDRGPSEPFDFALIVKAYSIQVEPQRFSLRLSVNADANEIAPAPERNAPMYDAYPFSWGARFAAVHEDAGHQSFPADLDACFEAWRGDGSDKPGSFSSGVHRHTFTVSAPSADTLDQGREIELTTRVAYLMVNKLVSCPGFATFAARIQDSGLSAAAGIDQLPTAQVLALCKATGTAEFVGLTMRSWGGHHIPGIGDACELAVKRDPSLAAEVARARASAQAELHDWQADYTSPEAREERRERQQREDQREERLEEAKRQWEQQQAQMQQDHDARMAALPGLINQAATTTQAAITPVQPPQRTSTPPTNPGSVRPFAQPGGPAAPAGSAPGTAPGTVPGNAPGAGQQLALQQCLAQAVPATTVVRTNPFLSYAQTFQSLLDKVRGACAGATSWSAWQACIGDNATGALWAFEDRAVADQANLASWYSQVASYYASAAPVCMWGRVQGTHADCLKAAGSVDVVRSLCATRLQADVDQMNCDFRMFPGVAAAQDKRAAVDAQKRHDDECRARAR